MTQDFFGSIYKNLQVPVIVCRDAEGYPVVFSNNSALALANPMLTAKNLKDSTGIKLLDDLIRFQRDELRENLFDSLRRIGAVNNYHADVLGYENRPFTVRITASSAAVSGVNYFVLYLEKLGESDGEKVMSGAAFAAFHLANQAENTEEAINKVLGLAGSYVKASRVYVFEEVSSTLTSNTYEWCDEGTEPAIQGLKELPKEDYNYDVIVNGGLYVTDDVRDLPENDRVILESQGIKSVAILPLAYAGKPLGYIGFDDCKNYRKWSSAEIQLLTDFSGIVVSLLVRRNSEAQANRSLSILQNISDNIDTVVYVTDVETDELLFINKTLANSLHLSPDQLIGQTCWKVLQQGKTERCEFCPVTKMIDKSGKIVRPTLSWEFQNTITGNWYLNRDAIFTWLDGRNAHIETATEITHQKVNEEKLRHSASIDIMTGVYNREWGYRIMQDIADSFPSETATSLVFIDLDGLKQVNDTFGHDAGDEKIIKTIDTIKRSVRQSDILCRWGGDEFILLLKCDDATALRIMGNIEANLAKTQEKEHLSFPLTISYGIMPFDVADGAMVDTIITKADQLMYKNKMSKRS